MRKSIYNFYRGTCHLFYEDLSKHKKIPFSPIVWVCGDLHMENFGSFRGDNRLVYFDLNDFDEAVLAPASWEIARFLTSLFVAFQAMDVEPEKAEKMAKLFLKSYSTTLANGRPIYLEPKTARGIVKNFLSAARDRKHEKLLEKKTKKVDGHRQIRITEKHMRIDEALKNELCAYLTDWIENHKDSPYNYEVLDVVFRVAGLGSLGLKRYMFLLKSTNVKEKYLLVDMKQSRNSSLQPFLKNKQPVWSCDATRIIAIQKRMQNVPPALLSSTRFKNEDYVIQEMQPAKDGIRLVDIKDRYRDIYQVVDDMATLTASAQLRSSGRQGSATADELILFGQSENWQEQVLNYAYKYTEKVNTDFQEFKRESIRESKGKTQSLVLTN